VPSWKERAEALESETYALYLAYRDSRTPWYARLWVALVLGYALSPIDLIPDFIPVIGYLDDLVIVPLGILIALKMMPAPVMAESRARAKEVIASGLPVNRAAAAVIILIWVMAIALAGWAVWRLFRH
jgi:uncharacterized membrane protein YkvA (DUF1232 family)